MYCILIGDNCVYACTDFIRFEREIYHYAGVMNARVEYRAGGSK